MRIPATALVVGAAVALLIAVCALVNPARADTLDPACKIVPHERQAECQVLVGKRDRAKDEIADIKVQLKAVMTKLFTAKDKWCPTVADAEYINADIPGFVIGRALCTDGTKSVTYYVKMERGTDNITITEGY